MAPKAVIVARHLMDRNSGKAQLALVTLPIPHAQVDTAKVAGQQTSASLNAHIARPPTVEDISRSSAWTPTTVDTAEVSTPAL